MSTLKLLSNWDSFTNLGGIHLPLTLMLTSFEGIPFFSSIWLTFLVHSTFPLGASMKSGSLNLVIFFGYLNRKSSMLFWTKVCRNYLISNSSHFVNLILIPFFFLLTLILLYFRLYDWALIAKFKLDATVMEFVRNLFNFYIAFFRRWDIYWAGF